MRGWLIGLALAASMPAFAEPDPSPRTGATETPKERRPLRGQRLRDAGIGLTVTGGIIALSGSALMITGAASMRPCTESRPDCNTGNAFMLVGGGAIAGLSVPFLGAGIPMWVVGERRLRHARASRIGVGRTSSHTPMLVLHGEW